MRQIHNLQTDSNLVFFVGVFSLLIRIKKCTFFNYQWAVD